MRLARQPARGRRRGRLRHRHLPRAQRPDAARRRRARRPAAIRAHEPVDPPAPAARRPGRAGGDLRGDRPRRHPAPPPLPQLRHLGAALPRGARPRPAGARDQAHHLPHQQRLADHARAGRGGAARQAGGGAGRDHRPLRRGAEHRLGPAARARGRPRRLRRREAQDPRQARAGGARGGGPAAPLRPRRHRQLPHRHGAHLRGPRPADRATRSSARRGALFNQLTGALAAAALPQAARRARRTCGPASSS